MPQRNSLELAEARALDLEVGPPGEAPQMLVVMQDEDAVGRRPDVELEEVGPLLDGAQEGREGVLEQWQGAAMGGDPGGRREFHLAAIFRRRPPPRKAGERRQAACLSPERLW
jgi:hypothetical protein